MSDAMIREHDTVVLTAAIPDRGLEAGDVGAVVHVYPGAAAFEVEFVTLSGKTAAVVTVPSGKVRSVTKTELPHARELALH